MDEFVLVRADTYAELIATRERMRILTEEVMKLKADSGYIVFDDELVRIVTGVKPQKREEE